MNLLKQVLAAFSLAQLPADVRAEIEALFASWAAKRLDGKVTPEEFLEFCGEFINRLMVIVNRLKDDAVKKAVVMAVAGALFDIFATKIAVATGFWGWLAALLLGSNAKVVFLNLVSLAIEVLYQANFKKAA